MALRGVTTICHGLVPTLYRAGKHKLRGDCGDIPRFNHVPLPKTPPPAQKEFERTSIARTSFVSVLYSGQCLSVNHREISN